MSATVDQEEINPTHQQKVAFSFVPPDVSSISPITSAPIPNITISPPTPIFDSTNIFSEKVINKIKLWLRN